jgi:hypothetical protein
MAEEETKNTTPEGREETTQTPPTSETEENKANTNEIEDGEEENKSKDIDPKDVNLDNPEEVATALDKKGIDYNTLTEEYLATGAISEANIKKLEEVGIPREMVDGYIKGYEARVEVEQNELGAIVGGRDKLEEIKNWAAANLSKEKIISLNAIRNREELELVLIGLKASMEDKEGKNPEYQKGTGNNVAVAGYRSQAEMFEAIKDPKYQKDPAYRQDVQKKITASREAGIDLGIY